MPLPKFEGGDYKFPDEQDDKAQESGDVTIEIEDDTPIPDRNRVPLNEKPEDPPDDELASYDEKVQDRIKKFSRGYHDERRLKETAEREREAAENFAKQVYEENKKLQQKLANGSKVLIEQSQSSAELELDAAKKRYKVAYEQGDIDAFTEAQADIAKATLRLSKVADMQPIEVDDKEYAPAVSEKPKLSPRTQKWIDSNSEWWGVDEEMTAAAMGLDRKLQKQYGADFIGTSEYFETIDKTMRKRFPEQFNEEVQRDEEDEQPRKRTSNPVDEDDEPPRRAKPASVVAPAARSTPPNRIRLKASEVTIARRLGVPIEDYAKQVALLKRNG